MKLRPTGHPKCEDSLERPRSSSRRALTAVIATLLAMLAALAVPALAQATDVTFDDLAAGTAVAQYPVGAGTPAISFGDPSSFGFARGTPANGVVSPSTCSLPIVTAHAPTHSAPNMAALSCGGEFPEHGTFAIMGDFANSVSAYVGSVSGGLTFKLDAYGFDHALLGTSTISASQPGTTNLISFSSAQFNIAYVAIYSPGTTNDDPMGMDDLTFNPCTPNVTCDPEVSLSTSAGGQISQGASIGYKVTLYRHNGSTGNVALSTMSLPSGVSASFNPTPVGSINTDSTMTISASATAPLATTTGIAVATPSPGAGSITQQVQFPIKIVPPFALYLGNDISQPSSATVAVAPCSSVSEGVRTLLGPGFPNSALTVAVGPALPGDISAISLAKNPMSNPGDFNLSGENDQLVTVSTNDSPSPAGSFVATLTPQSAPFVEPAATLTVNRLPVAVNSVIPTSVVTPQRLHVGGQIIIKGQGFCPGSMVTFGNTVATVPADSVSSDGTTIKVSTPLSATTGPVTVSSAGQTVTSASVVTVDSFRNVNGFQFTNYKPHITFDQMTEAFGADQTYDSVNLCVIACTVSFRDPVAMLLNAIANAIFQGGGGGACYGFSLASYRIRAGQRPISDFLGAALSPSTVFNLVAKANPDGAINAYINAQQVSLMSGPFLADYLEQSTEHLEEGGAAASNQVFQQIKDIFAHGRDPLLLLRDGDKAHVATAYNVEGAPPHWFIDVYDSNLPFGPQTAAATQTAPAMFGDEDAPDGKLHQQSLLASQIEIDSDGHWNLPSTGISSSMAAFVVDDPANLPEHPSMIGSAQSANLLGALGNVLFGSAGSPDSGSASPATPPSNVTQVSDASGHTLYDSHGNLNADKKSRLDAMPFAAPVAAASPTSGEPQMVLFGKGASTLTVTVKDTGLGADSHTFLGHGTDSVVTTKAGGSATDKLTFSPTGAGFATSAASKPLDVTLIGGSGSTRRVADVATTSARGGGDSVSFTAGDNAVALVHRGGPGTFTITLSGLDAKHAPETFKSGPIHIAKGARVAIGGIHWSALQGSSLTVSSGGHTTVVRNRYRAPRLASISKLQVKPLTGRTGKGATLTITKGGHGLPTGAQLVYSWTVRAAGKRVASHAAIAAAGKRSASFTFRAKHSGHYTFTGAVSVTTRSGLAQSSSTATRSQSFHV